MRSIDLCRSKLFELLSVVFFFHVSRPMMRSNNLANAQNINMSLNTIRVTTIITNYNRFNHISEWPINLFHHLSLNSFVEYFSFLYSLPLIQIIFERDERRKKKQQQTNTQLGIAWMSFVFCFSFLSWVSFSFGVLSYFSIIWCIWYLVDGSVLWFLSSFMVRCVCTEFFIGHELYKPLIKVSHHTV